MRALFGLIILMAAVACTTPADDDDPTAGVSSSSAATRTSTTTQSSTAATADEGIDLESFMDQLAAAGATIEAEESATDHFFVSSSTSTFCLNGRVIGVFSFESLNDQRRVSATIDKDDPSHVGNAIVEWVGPPTFWGRDEFSFRISAMTWRCGISSHTSSEHQLPQV